MLDGVRSQVVGVCVARAPGLKKQLYINDAIISISPPVEDEALYPLEFVSAAARCAILVFRYPSECADGAILIRHV